MSKAIYKPIHFRAGASVLLAKQDIGVNEQHIS